VRRWTRDARNAIFGCDLDLVVVPINVSQSHWVLIIINIKVRAESLLVLFSRLPLAIVCAGAALIV